MNGYTWIDIATFAAVFLLMLFFFRSLRVTAYRKRNIGFIAALVAVIAVKVMELVGQITGEGGALSLLRSFPSVFAHFSIWAFSLLGIMMFASNVMLMKHEGLRPNNMVGTFLGVLVIGATLLIYFFNRILTYTLGDTANPVLAWLVRFLPMFFYLLLDYVECILVGIIVMGWIASRGKPVYDKDFIIILGCSINKTGGLRPLLKGRTNRAIRYAWEQEIATGKKVCFVPSGGQGSDEVMSEGSAMALYLLSHAAEEDEIFPEKESANTYENFLFSKKIIDAQKQNARVAFSTTNYHVFRSGLLAREVGLNAEGIASSTKWYFWPNGFAREVVAIFVMTKKVHLVAALCLAAIAVLLSL